MTPSFRSLDPRDLQIAALAALLAWGMTQLAFDLRSGQVLATLAAALVAQALAHRAAGLPPARARFLGRTWDFDPRSALISGLSLCLLLRTSTPLWAVLAGALAIASKFVLRVRGKHVFNPTNIAIVALLFAHAPVWVSAGQWGQTALFALLMAGAGLIVVTRAARADVTLAFLGAWGALLFTRAAWLGQPWIAPRHQLANGALVLFACFMISDPRTTPDSRAGRIVYATLVALGAGAVQFLLYRTNGLLWSLAACALVVPLIDHWLPGSRHAWGAPPPRALPEGEPHERPWDRLRPAAVVLHTRPWLLRVLRRERRRETLQPCLAGGARARG